MTSERAEAAYSMMVILLLRLCRLKGTVYMFCIWKWSHYILSDTTSVFHRFLCANILCYGKLFLFSFCWRSSFFNFFWRKHLLSALKYSVLLWLGRIALIKNKKKPLLSRYENTGASVIHEMKWQKLMNHTHAHTQGERGGEGAGRGED